MYKVQKWYYIHKRTRHGPVREPEIFDLYDSGTISGNTYVWRRGMTDWQYLAQSEEFLSESLEDGLSGTAAHPVGRCPNCKKRVRKNTLIPAGSTQVCPLCRTIHLQRRKEGLLSILERRDYAGFWIRAFAYIIDTVIVVAILMIPSLFFAYLIENIPHTSEVVLSYNYSFSLFEALQSILLLSLTMGYYTFFHGNPKYQATPGKKIMGLKLIGEDGDRVCYKVAALRFVSINLSQILLCYGFLMAAMDMEHRTLHDRMCGTRVIKTNPPSPAQ